MLPRAAPFLQLLSQLGPGIHPPILLPPCPPDTTPDAPLLPPQPNPPLQAAYMFYTVPGATPLQQLMQDALTLAHSTGHDVFNALDIFENQKILKGARRLLGLGTACLVLHSHCI